MNINTFTGIKNSKWKDHVEARSFAKRYLKLWNRNFKLDMERCKAERAGRKANPALMNEHIVGRNEALALEMFELKNLMNNMDVYVCNKEKRPRNIKIK